MTSFSRSLAVAFLAAAMISTLVGCGPTRPEPSSQPKVLKAIATTVPKVTDLPLNRAQLVLSFVALKVGEVTLKQTEDPSLQGQVFEQHPAPGTQVQGGTPVDVKVYWYVSSQKKNSSPEAK